MENMNKFLLVDYGSNLGSRIFARHIFREIESQRRGNCIVIDFDGIKFISLSFATELLDSIHNVYSLDQIQLVNMSQGLVEKVISSARKTFDA